jgi:hypothetical protein
MQKKSGLKKVEQSARFREAAKKAGGADAKAFERAFKKIVSVKPSGRRSRPIGKKSAP